MSNLYTLLNEFRDQENLHSLEGDRGLENLEKIIEALGYKSNGFRFGNLIEVFLSDNSGACEALIDWIENQKSDEWAENIESCLEEEDSD